MRHETCLACRLPGMLSAEAKTMILLGESLGDFSHHHHTVRCGGCGAWWFDDVVMTGLSAEPLPVRRDTEFCACPDELPQYARSVVMVPAPESECACAKADVDRFSLPLSIGGKRPEADHADYAPYREAVSHVAACMADRTAFIIAAPPPVVTDAVAACKTLPGTTYYLDYGMPAVMRFRSPHLWEATGVASSQMPGTMAAVLVVPKTVSARRLSRLLRGASDDSPVIPADGSQDLIILQSRDLIDFPRLLVDAVGKVDPEYAAAIWAGAGE